ncbi:MAG: hypothetical protein D3913_15130 [Candidatus Electrothrix sp. LOE1_4_5]|nr:hypothetical protein [Candidatus Electrothrix gigas]
MGKSIKLAVSHRKWYGTNPGDIIKLEVKQGLLGFRWIKKIKKIKNVPTVNGSEKPQEHSRDDPFKSSFALQSIIDQPSLGIQWII